MTDKPRWNVELEIEVETAGMSADKRMIETLDRIAAAAPKGTNIRIGSVSRTVEVARSGSPLDTRARRDIVRETSRSVHGRPAVHP